MFYYAKVYLFRELRVSGYHYYSKFAARAERARQYTYAAMLWSKAACLADNCKNAEWAAWRKDFCVARSVFHQEIVREDMTAHPGDGSPPLQLLISPSPSRQHEP